MSTTAVLGDHACVAPGAQLGGSVVVGEEAYIGMGSTVLQGVIIGERAVVGAGAVVLDDVSDDRVVAGIPARTIHSV